MFASIRQHSPAFASIRFVVCFLLITAWLPTNAISQVDCPWSNTCQDPWEFQRYDIWIPVTTSPPCSVAVRVYVKQRCGQIEIQDMGYGVIILSPPGCATVQQVMDMWGTGAMTNGIYAGVANALMTDYLLANPTCCPCPSTMVIEIGTVVRCFKLILSYTIPDPDNPTGGQVVSQWYDLSKPWSLYDLQIQLAGGINPTIGVEPCLGTGCCKRERTICIQDHVVNYTDGAWTSFGECSYNPEGQCQVLFCE